MTAASFQYELNPPNVGHAHLPSSGEWREGTDPVYVFMLIAQLHIFTSLLQSITSTHCIVLTHCK